MTAATGRLGPALLKMPNVKKHISNKRQNTNLKADITRPIMNAMSFAICLLVAFCVLRFDFAGLIKLGTIRDEYARPQAVALFPRRLDAFLGHRRRCRLPQAQAPHAEGHPVRGSPRTDRHPAGVVDGRRCTGELGIGSAELGARSSEL